MRALLIGNYGVGNVGDEALKDYFLARFPQVSWTVVSASPHGPNEVPRLPFGFRSLFTPWWKTLRAIRHCDAVVLGGGTLFTDTESVRACFLWGWHVLAVRLLRRPVLLAFQGIGPFRTKAGEWVTRRILAVSCFVSIRDAESYSRVLTLRKNTNVIQSADPVLLLMQKEKNDAGTQNVISVIPRKNVPETFFETLASLPSRYPDSLYRIVLLQPRDTEEKKAADRIRDILGDCQVREVTSLSTLRDALRGSRYVLSARYHGALAALTLGIPFDVSSQAGGDKLSTLSAADLSAMIHLASDGERMLLEAIQNCAE